MFSIFATYLLTVTMHMPLDSHTMLDRTSTYTYTGMHSKERCEKERSDTLATKPEKGDTITASACTKK